MSQNGRGPGIFTADTCRERSSGLVLMVATAVAQPSHRAGEPTQWQGCRIDRCGSAHLAGQDPALTRVGLAFAAGRVVFPVRWIGPTMTGMSTFANASSSLLTG